ncbi:MAG: DnaJ domain-containing protein [Cyclobacteriaceae bacterium]|nr:DnaJ domain-containing protein [Cyclobacteriaceae bacterium]
MGNHYLKSLGLEPGASKSEIKSAYRKLTKRYHPDVSKDPNAKEQFIRITEAYKFLTQVGPRPHREKVSYDYNPKESEYSRRRAQARAWARKRAKEAAKRHYHMLYRFHNVFRHLVLAMFLFNMVLAIDYLLPLKQRPDRVSKIYRIFDTEYSEFGRGTEYYRYNDIYFEHYTMRFDRDEGQYIKENTPAIIYATPLLNKPRRVMMTINSHPTTLRQLYGIYDFYFITVPVMLVLSFGYQRIISLEHKLSIGVIMFMILVVQYFLL